jgi:hypothetical protein
MRSWRGRVFAMKNAASKKNLSLSATRRFQGAAYYIAEAPLFNPNHSLIAHANLYTCDFGPA